MTNVYQRRPRIIIVGSGRSGTSTVARLCHENLGVCFGHELKAADELNPKGYYEDIISHGLLRQMVEHIVNMDRYMQIMNNLHSKCTFWGVKDPWFLFVPKPWLVKLDPKLCIICDRSTSATVQSWLKVYEKSGKTPDEKVIAYYTKLTNDRHALCEQLKDIWLNHMTINFDTQQDEEVMIRRIKAKLG